jgi:hypothetical protein
VWGVELGGGRVLMSPAHADVASTVRDSIEARNSTPITPERNLRGVLRRGAIGASVCGGWSWVEGGC